MAKPLNIGLVGYGFMGRTHSNAYKRVNDFFNVDYRPVLKAVCGRSGDAWCVRRRTGATSRSRPILQAADAVGQPGDEVVRRSRRGVGSWGEEHI